ncbi:hypothetical protein KIW84_043754 [Lathyrus oleraceus]|uniref:Uncharacterized protein n=1 Tax=Pisum sativum TaxID=3888 RepID=A0A9D5API1_PEA|nr:hypothetical protein KIW84_043754 [Pisum sativum]
MSLEKFLFFLRLELGVVLSGGQAPGSHNAISGILDYLQDRAKGSILHGFRVGGHKIDRRKLLLLAAVLSLIKVMAGVIGYGPGCMVLKSSSVKTKESPSNPTPSSFGKPVAQLHQPMNRFIDTLIKIRKYTICSMEFMNPGMEPKCIRIAGWISFAEEILVFFRVCIWKARISCRRLRPDLASARFWSRCCNLLLGCFCCIMCYLRFSELNLVHLCAF